MKLCFKCRALKSLSEFYRHAMMRDGHLNKCKECTKKDANSNRDVRQSYYREYDRRRYATDENRRAASRKHNDGWTARNADGKRAQTALRNAIRAGKLRREPCAVCGREDSHGHHPDYSKPFDVMWLCPVHHAEQHQREGKMRPGETWKATDAKGVGTKTYGRAAKTPPENF